MPHCANCGSELTPLQRFCPSCGTPAGAAPTPPPSTEGVKGSGVRRAAMILVPLALIAGLFIYVSFLEPGLHSVIRGQPVVSAPVQYDSTGVGMTDIRCEVRDGEIVFPLNDVLMYRLVRFHHAGGKTPRDVMAYLAPDGRVVTAISYSENCRSNEFYLENNQICCAHCPSRWDMMTMEAFACCGKYYPDPIPSRVEEGFVRIRKEEVERWAGRL